MNILAFSDIHGNSDAVRKLISEVSDIEFDIIVFGGDFTNAWFDGLDEGKKQMREISSLLKSLNKPFFYVYGNRDILPHGHVKCPFGNNIEEKDWSIDKYTLTNKINKLSRSKILVTHSLNRKFKDKQANALLYMYGHDHNGRLYKNYIDLGFLYRGTTAHGAAQPLYGCYWIISLEKNIFHIENYSWQLKESICPKHNDQGIFYIPYYWKKECPLCYNEKENSLNF